MLAAPGAAVDHLRHPPALRFVRFRRRDRCHGAHRREAPVDSERILHSKDGLPHPWAGHAGVAHGPHHRPPSGPTGTAYQPVRHEDRLPLRRRRTPLADRRAPTAPRSRGACGLAHRGLSLSIAARHAWPRAIVQVGPARPCAPAHRRAAAKRSRLRPGPGSGFVGTARRGGVDGPCPRPTRCVRHRGMPRSHASPNPLRRTGPDARARLGLSAEPSCPSPHRCPITNKTPRHRTTRR